MNSVAKTREAVGEGKEGALGRAELHTDRPGCLWSPERRVPSQRGVGRRTLLLVTLLLARESSKASQARALLRSVVQSGWPTCLDGVCSGQSVPLLGSHVPVG